MESVRKWATIAEGAIDPTPTKFTLTSVTATEHRQQQQRRSQSPAPRVAFDDYNIRSPALETTRNRPSAFYRQPDNRSITVHDRRPSFNNTSIFNCRSTPLHSIQPTTVARRFNPPTNALDIHNVLR